MSDEFLHAIREYGDTLKRFTTYTSNLEEMRSKMSAIFNETSNQAVALYRNAKDIDKIEFSEKLEEPENRFTTCEWSYA
jgi:hypothetical protein